MRKIPHAPGSWHCNCKRCRRKIDRLFGGDRAFFDANLDRRLYCREFVEGELPPEPVEGLPAGYRPVTVSWLCKPGANQLRLRRVYGWPLLMRCPNDCDRAIIAAFGHLGELERLWRAGMMQ
jgi:hypothetical protein